MTGFLLGTVVVLAVLWLLHLVVLLGVVRRLREYESRLADLATAPPGVITLPVGGRIGRFETRAVDGRPVSSAALDDEILAGFFSPQCDACHDRIGDFREAAAAHAGTTLAVVVRDGGDTEALAAELDGAATVVIEEMGGALSSAFGVSGFPAFARVDAGGVLVAQGYEPPPPPPHGAVPAANGSG